MAKAWMRLLEVHLTSRKLKKKKVYGANADANFAIDINGHKYMSTLKDECIIKIDNLTYTDVITMIQGEYFDVEIKAGYRSQGVQTIFKGGILYISNSLNADRTNTVIILCASELVARYGQSRLNLSLNSGINLYSAINFVCKRAGIQNTNISTQFKKKFLQDVANCNDSAASWIDKLTSTNSSYISNSDSVTSSIVSIFDANKSSQRIINLKSSFINLAGGYPQLDSNGLRLSIMPTFSFMCGDIIQIDNSIISLPVQNKSDVSKNYGYYLDKDGQYMIYQASYRLQNRGSAFSFDLTCKSRSLISNFSGV